MTNPAYLSAEIPLNGSRVLTIGSVKLIPSISQTENVSVPGQLPIRHLGVHIIYDITDIGEVVNQPGPR